MADKQVLKLVCQMEQQTQMQVFMGRVDWGIHDSCLVSN